jgi:glycosyltransferase involved in cell wall biosynthesis
MPTVSVIIPVYNGERFISMTLQSVLNQTYTDWEAIIVDDGSTDNTCEVVAQFDDPRLHYIYQKNQGTAAARNTGIRRAQGEYLTFLDADDEWESTFLQVCVRTLAYEKAATAVVTRTRFIDEKGNLLPQRPGPMYTSQQLRERLLEGGFFGIHAVLVRTEAVWQAGLFDERLTNAEDWDLWLRIMDFGEFLPILDPLAYYRISLDSKSTNIDSVFTHVITILTKRFGVAEGDPMTWSEEKRKVYAFAYRRSALDHLQRGNLEVAWNWLRQSAQLWPKILERLDTFYELALGDQPRGYRGDVQDLDIECNSIAIIQGLDALFASASEPVRAIKGSAYGNAYLALAMLSDQVGQWRQARQYLLRALRSYPALLRDVKVLRRLLKLYAGQRLTSCFRSSHREMSSGV